MRSLLIVIVLGVTALTFYSALWFKSETIEDDITLRVTDDLASSGANNIDIQVDGRHVTLAGVVNDDATESAYLGTADATYGALGPIDGLTVQGDGGYVNAIKTAEGISLRGTVPNEDVRASLIAEATAATDGVVDDQLTVAGREAAWQTEAAFGVRQLAGLTSGSLTAAAGAFALSGNTEVDPDAVTAELADREGWTALVSSNVEQQGLSAQVDRLTAEVAARDASVNELGATVSGLETEIGTLKGERDALGGELADLKAGLSEGEANVADLRAQLEAASTTIDGKDQTIADLSGQVTESGEQITALEAELENRQAALGNTDERIIVLMSDLNNAKGELETSKSALATANGELDAANGALEAANGELEAANGALAVANGELETANGTIADLSTQVSERDTIIAGLTGDVADRDTTIEDLNGQVARLSENADQSVADLTDALSERDGQIADLTQTVADRDVTIEGLSGQLTDAESRLAAAENDVAVREATIATLNGQVAERDGSIASTVAQVAALTAAAQTADADKAALEGQVADLTGRVGERDETIADLTARVSARDETIAALRAQPAPSGNIAAQCAAQATGVLAGSNINFRTASADISDDSVELLERLTGIALACVGDDLTVEIGGHTDAQGSADDNQALSEARARAVAAFMAERGVQTNGLQAVGFGESAPIASNDTAEGRAQNRRISFDWQAR